MKCVPKFDPLRRIVSESALPSKSVRGDIAQRPTWNESSDIFYVSLRTYILQRHSATRKPPGARIYILAATQWHGPGSQLVISSSDRLAAKVEPNLNKSHSQIERAS